MGIFQPPVPPLKGGIDLSGQSALVTGASRGIGREICNQFLEHKLSSLILAVRNVEVGETVRKELLAQYPQARIEVLRFDAADLEGVKRFAADVKAKFPELHIAMLNAGLGTFWRETAGGHEMNVQVNYIANVLLTLELLPLLEATADKTGKPSRITWTGSRMYRGSTLLKPGALPTGEAPIAHLDKAKNVHAGLRYCNSKLLVAAWILELAEHYKSSDKVIVNNFCPGAIITGMADPLPLIVRVPVKLFTNMRGRSVDKAGWIALNAAVHAGKESHGRLLGDMELVE